MTSGGGGGGGGANTSCIGGSGSHLHNFSDADDSSDLEVA